MSCSVPVALILFNRPQHVKAVFKTIAKAKPTRLFVIADGPRFPEEQSKCLQARAVAEQVDWDCQVLTNYADANLGCRERVVSGLNWVFSLAEEAIILEDDCVPHASFFRYCENLLHFYRDNEQIMEISGCNYRRGRISYDYSYYFSRYYHTLGWATWRRAWKHYDVNISAWAEFKWSPTWATVFETKREERFWTRIFDQIAEGGLLTSWDYQWQLARWRHNGLAAVPTVNLVSNIGFDPEATHTKSEHDFRAMLAVQDIGDIRHPGLIIRNIEADKYRFNRVELVRPTLLWKITNRLQRIMRFLWFRARKYYLHEAPFAFPINPNV
jgi:hypothetical protein